MTSVNAFATLFEAFFNIFFADTHTHAHRHEGIALTLLRMHARGNYLHRIFFSLSGREICVTNKSMKHALGEANHSPSCSKVPYLEAK